MVVFQIGSTIAAIAAAMWTGLYFGYIRKERAESRIEKSIMQEAIKGNKVAVYLHRFRVVKEKEGQLIKEALSGNESAMMALGFNKKDMERLN
jgi:hypothetical protein